MPIMSGFPRETVKLLKYNTDIVKDIQAAFFVSKILVDDISLQIEEGDTIERILPSGIKEKYVITNCIFCNEIGSIPSHYQLEVKKQTAYDSDNVMQELKKIAQTLENAEEIIQKIDSMEQNIGKKVFFEKYNDFIQSVANHMTAFSPLIPALTQFLTSTFNS